MQPSTLPRAAAAAFLAWAAFAQQPKQPPQQYRSKIAVYDLAKHASTTIYQADQVIE